MKGLDDAEAAAREAREEAGVTGAIWSEPIGCYEYLKQEGQEFAWCEVRVYPLEVKTQLDTWLEKGQRDCRWFSAGDALRLVDDPGLREIISTASATILQE